MMNIDLNAASNLFGPLPGEVRARLVQFIREPAEHTWNSAYSVILSREPSMTLWQAVIAVDPQFKGVRGPVTKWVPDTSELGGHSERVSGWERIPTAETVLQAVNYATR